MRPWLQTRTPAQLLWLAIALNILVSAGFLGLGLLHRHNGPQLTFNLLLGSTFAIIVIGTLASLFIEQEMKNGIAAERWPDYTIERLRKFLAHPAFTVLRLVLFVAAILCIVVTFPRNSIWFWAIFWPELSISRIRGLAHPERPGTSNRLFSPDEPPKPLHSDHWGDPPGTFAR